MHSNNISISTCLKVGKSPERECLEREREKNETEQEYQWTTVNRKKPKPHQPKASRTCFLNHLPSTSTISTIAKIFRSHGAIANIHIPQNQKNPNHIYAFVQFYHPQSLITAIRDENGRIIEGNRISVHPAKHDKQIPHIPRPLNHKKPDISKTTQKTPTPYYPNMRGPKSYKEITKPSPKPTLTHPNPTTHRVMSSRMLGEETENIRKSLGAIEINEDYDAALKGTTCDENIEMLQRSAIAIASSSQSSELILNHILSEGVNCLTIKPMGGMQHLIIFDTFEDKKAIMESKWLQRWFTKIINVNNKSATLWRETWLNIYGVPLVAWGYKKFFDIGCIFGRVISVNYKNYDQAQILVFTDCLFEINSKISFEVDGEKYDVHVSETRQT